ncbi:MAG: hypothetical protein ACREUV_05675 [Burkholderiales bacterium]
MRLGQYETVEHLWVESWRTVVCYPTYATREDGIEALKKKAARLGANGVINVVCSSADGLYPLSLRSQSLLCHGMAIRVR